MALEMTATQQAEITFEARDIHGNVATVENAIWATDNTDVLALEPSFDGQACMVRATGMVGTANVQLTADADLGEGESHLIGTLAVQITAGTAVTVTLTAGTPEEQPG